MSAHKPAGHNAVSPYLLVTDASRMLVFLRATFDAEPIFQATTPEGRVKHAEVRIEDSIVMFGERPGSEVPMHCSTHVYVPDVDACYRRALDAGASSVAAPEDQSYGNRSAGVKDPDGNIWWLGTQISQPS